MKMAPVLLRYKAMADKEYFSLKNILEMHPEDLVQVQHDALKNATMERLAKIAKLIKNEQYIEAKDMLQVRRACDGISNTNLFIDFSDFCNSIEDIGDVLIKLDQLNNFKNLNRR